MDKYDTNDDHYCYLDSDVLINKLNITDEEEFEEAERAITNISITHIHYSKPPYNLQYLQDLHKALFTELYDWAGEIRTVKIAKGGTLFCQVAWIQSETEKVFKNLQSESYLVNYSNSKLISKLAKYYGDLNIIHPFREGNGRVQRLLFEHIALHCGYHLDWSLVKSRQEWIQANIDSVLIENEKLESIFTDILEKVE